MKFMTGMILAALGIVTIAACSPPARESELRQSTAAIDSLQGVIHDLRETCEAERERARHPIHPVDVNILKEKGLEDPLFTLVSNLQTRSDLIPFQNPRGLSQFGFYDVERIIVLDERFVFAEADDGHGDGRLLLQYEVLGPAAVQWTVVWANRG